MVWGCRACVWGVGCGFTGFGLLGFGGLRLGGSRVWVFGFLGM
jgi:hypothetical protein